MCKFQKVDLGHPISMASIVNIQYMGIFGLEPAYEGEVPSSTLTRESICKKGTKCLFVFFVVLSNNTFYIAVDGSDQYWLAYNPGSTPEMMNGNLSIQKLQCFTHKSFELNILHAAIFRKLVNQIKRDMCENKSEPSLSQVQ
jgi:hypothetical protein